MMTWEEIKSVEPLVEETLTEAEVIEILSNDFGERLIAMSGRNHTAEEFRNALDGYPRLTVINNAVLHNWDGVDHDGVYLIYKKDKDTIEEFFMERSYPSVYPSRTVMVGKPVYHRLLPIDTLRAKKRAYKNSGSLKSLINLIVYNSTIDDISYETDYAGHSSGLSAKDAFKSREFASAELSKAYEIRKREIIAKFANGDVPAGDEMWDDLLCGNMTPIMHDVFHILRARGHHINLDGERDSFGWVTCGIVMDGELMTSMYF